MTAQREEPEYGPPPLEVLEGGTTHDVPARTPGGLEDSPLGGIALGAVISTVAFWIPAVVIAYFVRQ